jgi:hypothetical protein
MQVSAQILLDATGSIIRSPQVLWEVKHPSFVNQTKSPVLPSFYFIEAVVHISNPGLKY